MEIINYGPCVIKLWQEWSLGELFGEITSLVPEVSSLAKLVPGYSKVEKGNYGPLVIQVWQIIPLGKLWKLAKFSPRKFRKLQ